MRQERCSGSKKWQPKAATDPAQLDFNPFRYLKCIIHFNAQIPHGTCHTGMTEQDLNRPQVLGLFVD